MKSIVDIAQEYINWDTCSKTRGQIEAWVRENNLPELEMALRDRMVFGTAGLRAAMGSGYSRINNLTVQQSSQGLAEYLKKVNPQDFASRGVVIGHDHRANEFANSKDLADVTAATFLAKGFKVFYFKDLVHTPLVPFSVSKIGALCGVMITASHNPKDDNGYKVYWENGCQIIPPHDEGIAEHIRDNLTPIQLDLEILSQALDVREKMVSEYYSFLTTLVHHRDDNAETRVSFCYTAMHGVGYPFAKRAAEISGIKRLIATAAQVEPDPAFPTVAFPNPEEGKGALKLAIEAAEECNCTVILANDPDADRLAVAEKDALTGQWIVLNGNQLGTILGHYLFTEASQRNVSKIAMVNSTVSSKMLGMIANMEGFHHVETLTGFKWIGNMVAELERDGFSVPFAYEEAIGYMCGGMMVKDKDGVSALVSVVEMTVQLAKRGLGLLQYLDTLYKKYGYFVSNNSYFISSDQVAINTCFDRIRYGAEPKRDTVSSKHKYVLQYPTTIGGLTVSSVRDLTIGYDSSTADQLPTLPVSSSSQMITFKFADQAGEVTLRTSGTEPKVKYYIECRAPTPELTRQVLEKVTLAVRESVLNYKRFKFMPPRQAH